MNTQGTIVKDSITNSIERKKNKTVDLYEARCDHYYLCKKKFFFLYGMSHHCKALIV